MTPRHAAFIPAYIATFNAAALLAAAPANAQSSGPYASLGAELVNYDTPSLVEGDGFAAVGRLGYDFGRYFGLEGELSLGLSGDSSESLANGVEDTVSYNSRIGGYLRGRLPVGERGEVFLRLGLSERSIDARRTFNDPEFEDFDFFDPSGSTALSGGVGAQFAIGADSRNLIRFDVTAHSEFNLGGDEDDVDYSDVTLSLAYVRRF